jgi:hypothetical protein
MQDEARDGARTRDEMGERIFPGWEWVAVALAFPVAGLIGRAVSGPVDEPFAALIGGILTGAGLGAVQWLVAKDAFGDGRIWVTASALGYGAGLLAGAAVVGYDTDIGSLAAMGAISGVVLGLVQGFALVEQGRRRLALPWAAAMPFLLALGWIASTAIGVDVDKQFTVFGAMGAIVFMLLSGLLLARFTPSPAKTV